MTAPVDETVRCSYEGNAIPPGTTYLDCDGDPFCDWHCHQEAHGKCPAAVDRTTESE